MPLRVVVLKSGGQGGGGKGEPATGSVKTCTHGHTWCSAAAAAFYLKNKRDRKQGSADNAPVSISPSESVLPLHSDIQPSGPVHRCRYSGSVKLQVDGSGSKRFAINSFTLACACGGPGSVRGFRTPAVQNPSAPGCVRRFLLLCGRVGKGVRVVGRACCARSVSISRSVPCITGRPLGVTRGAGGSSTKLGGFATGLAQLPEQQ